LDLDFGGGVSSMIPHHSPRLGKNSTVEFEKEELYIALIYQNQSFATHFDITMNHLLVVFLSIEPNTYKSHHLVW